VSFERLGSDLVIGGYNPVDNYGGVEKCTSRSFATSRAWMIDVLKYLIYNIQFNPQ
jgi:hypothetical protein